jgi:hypothetical protein
MAHNFDPLTKTCRHCGMSERDFQAIAQGGVPTSQLTQAVIRTPVSPAPPSDVQLAYPAFCGAEAAKSLHRLMCERYAPEGPDDDDTPDEPTVVDAPGD